MIKVHYLQQLLLAAFLLLASPASPEEFPMLAIEALPVHQWEPGLIKYKVLVQSHYQNTMLCYGYESPTKFRRSCFEIRGIYSPRVYWQEYKDLSAADYVAFAELYRAHGIVARQAKPFIVMQHDRTLR